MMGSTMLPAFCIMVVMILGGIYWLISNVLDMVEYFIPLQYRFIYNLAILFALIYWWVGPTWRREMRNEIRQIIKHK